MEHRTFGREDSGAPLGQRVVAPASTVANTPAVAPAPTTPLPPKPVDPRLVNLADGALSNVLLVKEMYRYDKDAPNEQGEYLGQQVRYWCEGCGYAHDIGAQAPGREAYKGGANWTWNGDAALPVLSPSQLHRTYHWPQEKDDPEGFAEMERIYEGGNSDALMNHPKYGYRCHTFIGINGAGPGEIIYLHDCSKPEMRGQVRKLLPRSEWPDRHWSKVGVQA